MDRFVSACGRWISEAIYTVPSGPFWCQRTLRQGDMVAAVAEFLREQRYCGKSEMPIVGDWIPFVDGRRAYASCVGAVQRANARVASPVADVTN